jgi:sugar/nucleoside kinase (ribokinase family)
MNVIAIGAHILDVLVRPVTDIPAGQDTALVEQMRMTAAGTAAGTALTFAKLGATVQTAGAIGTEPAGDLLLSLLGRAGIDTSLVVRKPDVPTSMSVLPIRPNGERPALHLLGANLSYTLDDVDWDAVAAADHLHLGGTEMLGPDFATRILKHAKETRAQRIRHGRAGLVEGSHSRSARALRAASSSASRAATLAAC